MRAIITINDHINSVNSLSESISKKMNFCIKKIEDTKNINSIIDDIDAAIIIVGIDKGENIQPYLNSLREVRIPYIFVKPDQEAEIKTILLPVTNLMEDRERSFCPIFFPPLQRANSYIQTERLWNKSRN